MNTLEKTFWALVRKHLPKGAHHQRIETGSVGTGIPDVNVCYEGVETWIELKVVKGRRVELSPEQAAWAHRRCRAKGRSLIVARDKADGVRKGKYDRIYVWDGKCGPEVIEKGIAAEGSTIYEAPYNWDQIMDHLLR